MALFGMNKVLEEERARISSIEESIKSKLNQINTKERILEGEVPYGGSAGGNHRRRGLNIGRMAQRAAPRQAPPARYSEVEIERYADNQLKALKSVESIILSEQHKTKREIDEVKAFAKARVEEAFENARKIVEENTKALSKERDLLEADKTRVEERLMRSEEEIAKEKASVQQFAKDMELKANTLFENARMKADEVINEAKLKAENLAKTAQLKSENLLASERQEVALLKKKTEEELFQLQQERKMHKTEVHLEKDRLEEEKNKLKNESKHNAELLEAERKNLANEKLRLGLVLEDEKRKILKKAEDELLSFRKEHAMLKVEKEKLKKEASREKAKYAILLEKEKKRIDAEMALEKARYASMLVKEKQRVASSALQTIKKAESKHKERYEKYEKEIRRLEDKLSRMKSIMRD